MLPPTIQDLEPETSEDLLEEMGAGGQRSRKLLQFEARIPPAA